MVWSDYIPRDIQGLYEIHEDRHAAAILSGEFPEQFGELCLALRTFRFTVTDVITPGGNESTIPKRFASILRPLGWVEKRLSADLVADGNTVRRDSHYIDHLKGRVAFDVEWNSKDQTFDRDLFAFRTFFDYDQISVGVIVTRSNELDPWFATLGETVSGTGKRAAYKTKYGASTTHLGKLLPRLTAGRNGGCPVLALGITSKLLEKE